MSQGPTVAAAILSLLADRGIDTCFGIPGVHNLALWDALGPGLPRVIGVRHEQAAGYAADGLYRATGRSAAALVTSGPGATNVVTAFGEAYTARSPMLVLASDVNAGLRRAGGTRGILHEVRDQAAFFAAFGASAASPMTADTAVSSVARALERMAAPPHEPAYVGVPADVLGEAYRNDLEPAPDPTVAPAAVDPAGLEAVADLVRDAQRLVVWLGGGVVSAGVEEPVRRLVERTGAVVVTSFAGRGLLAGHPQLADAPVHEPEVRAVLAEADLLLVLGSDFDAMNTMNWKLPLPSRRVAITLGSSVENTVDWTECLGLDLAVAAPQLDELVAARLPAASTPWMPGADALRGTVFARLRRDDRVAEAIRFTDALEAGWPQSDAMVADMAVAGFWASLYSHQSRPRRTQYPVGWGTLGYALPAAMGPASQGVPTLAVCGDGGPMFALGELATYAQESLPVTLLVVDDGGYGMLRFDQQVFGHHERGVDLLMPDWVALAGSFGITGTEVPDVAALPGALRPARAANLRGEPRVLVWKTRLYPPRTTSPRWFEADAG